MTIRFNVNGKAVDVKAEADTPLLWVIRDEIGLTGTKFGCGFGICGACTVHLDGVPVRSCQTPLSAVENKSVATIESMASTEIGKRVQAGQIMSAVSLLKATPKPTDADIDNAMSGNLCRCGTYPRIRAAIQMAAGTKGA
jgi:isoquinoline 1-oxidoreductase alpha subunit